MVVSKNSKLSSAKSAKNDEFYTRWEDIQYEINAYLEYDPHAFRGKVILLPCDDPEWSNFTKYFALHFGNLGIKKLISTSYAPKSNAGGAFYQPTIFEIESPSYDPNKSFERGRVFTLTEKDISGDGVINIDDLQWEYLEGDGDFRSAEIVALRDEADFVITNGPFSLFREFLAWLVEGEVKFTVIANKNCITYKEVFPLIKANKIWSGASSWSGGMWFELPKSAEKVDAYEDGKPMGNVPSIWLTNIDHGRRHEPLKLMTLKDNLNFSKHQKVKDNGYPKYENYEAIEVPFTDSIPSDYKGTMGVPISFLEKYNPKQFEIIGNGQTMANELGIKPVGQKFVDDYYAQGNKGQINAKWNNLVYRLGERTVVPYQRILIRHKGK